MADSTCSSNPFFYTPTSNNPPVEDDAACISIDKCEKGFIITHCNKEYACESLHSAYEIIKKLFSPTKQRDV
jgi:hypothetical protein